MVAPEGFEPPTFWFVAKRSIQLSYGVTSALFFNSKAIITKTGQIVNTFSKKAYAFFFFYSAKRTLWFSHPAIPP